MGGENSDKTVRSRLWRILNATLKSKDPFLYSKENIHDQVTVAERNTVADMESDQLPTPSSCCPGLDYASHTSAQASLGCLLAPTPLEKNLIGTAGIAPESSDQVHTQSL